MRKRLPVLLLSLYLSVAAADIGGDFTLTDHNGGTFELQDARGKVVVMVFGYTSCPDICPLTLSLVKRILDELGPLAKRVQPLFVSVDPKRDTPQRLALYVRHFHPAILGLTGTAEELRDVTAQYSTFFRIGEDQGSGFYPVDHSSNLYLIGPDGALGDIVLFGLPAEISVSAIRRLLAADSSRSK